MQRDMLKYGGRSTENSADDNQWYCTPMQTSNIHLLDKCTIRYITNKRTVGNLSNNLLLYKIDKYSCIFLLFNDLLIKFYFEKQRSF